MNKASVLDPYVKPNTARAIASLTIAGSAVSRSRQGRRRDRLTLEAIGNVGLAVMNRAAPAVRRVFSIALSAVWLVDIALLIASAGWFVAAPSMWRTPQ